MIKIPWTSETVPHLMLEINQQCNISCKGCYKWRKGTHRSLDAITKDLDLAMSRSKIHTVSIAGAEPTLHPELCAIVRLVHDRGLKTVLITNGLLLDSELLTRLKKAGLHVVMLHIDEGQDRPDFPSRPSLEEINALRARLAASVAAHDIDACLVVTVYRDYLDRVAGLVRFVLDSEHIDLLLVTHYVDFHEMVEVSQALKDTTPVPPGHRQDARNFPGDRTTNQDIARILQESFGLEPFAYLPSGDAIDRKEAPTSWLSYYVPVIQSRKECEFLKIESGALDSLLMSVARLIARRHVFYFRPSSMAVKMQVILNAIAQGRIRECVRFLTALKRPGARLSAKRLVFDNGPTLAADGRIVCAEFCPTPTVRNGKLVPVCMSDFEVQR